MASDELYATVRRAYPYRDLERCDFDEVVSMLADGVATSRGRSGTFLHYDRVNGRLRARRGARLAAITCGGAIPDTANYNVVVEPEGRSFGTLDEDFAIESMAGDIFLLGTNSWKIRRVEAGVVRVEDAHGAPPSIPFWNGEGLGRTIELSREVCAVRAAIDERDDASASRMARSANAPSIAPVPNRPSVYVRAGKARSRRRSDGTHDRRGTFFRRRRRNAADPAYAFRSADQSRVGTLAAKTLLPFVQPRAASRRDRQRLRSLADRFSMPFHSMRSSSSSRSASAKESLRRRCLPAPMFAARWRWNAARALAILRFSGGRKFRRNSYACAPTT